MSERKTIEERVSDYDQIRSEAAKLYGTFDTVVSPALNQNVRFSSLGFNHLVYQAPKKMRDKRAQILRFDMLEKANFIIGLSSTYQEYEEEIISKKINRYGTWFPENIFVKRWGLVAIINKFRVKVVLTQEGNGAIEFLSVVPAWTTTRYRNIKLIHNSIEPGLIDVHDEDVIKNATQG